MKEPFWARDGLSSDVVGEVTNTNSKGGSNADERINRNRFFAAFDFADVFRIEVCLFAKLLLRHFRSLSTLANGGSKQFPISRLRRHKGSVWKRAETINQL